MPKGVKKPILLDGVIQNTLYPDTFEIPDESSRKSIQAEQFAKIVAGQERFWVKVIQSIPQSNSYIGRVDNDLIYTEEHGLSYNDLVEFNEKNVIGLLT
jgi:hypothetical protein